MLRLRSHAKINWHLEVLGRRSDGYHELRTLFQTIDLADEVALESIAHGIELEIAGGDGRLAADRTNLAWRAAELFFGRFAPTGGVRIRIEKRIPLGGGLGGGSSNAATVLAGLARLHAADVSRAELMAAAAELGADVPFFLAGGVALGTGRGDRIEPLDDSATASRALRLAVPPFAVPTRDVFAAHVVGAPRAVPAALARAFAGELPRDLAELGGWNDLEPTCLQLFPRLAEVYNRLQAAGAIQVRLSGSGGTVYALFANVQAAERAGSAIPVDFSWISARTLGRSEWGSSAEL
jgi:4-diphosphocytidyl-2-C-methyl-D-erythritol kinase